MSHDLEIKADGTASMAYAGATPWHGLGTSVDGVMTAAECLTLAGLDWEVELEPVSNRYGEIPNRFSVVRQTDHRTFGIVGRDYKVINNVEAFAFFDQVVDSGEAKYETAGSLAGGQRVWITAKVGDDIEICGEKYKGFLLVSNSHDGSRAFRALTTMIRVVCANTETMALNAAKTSWSLTHKFTLEGKTGEARRALELSFAGQDAFAQEVERMLNIQVNADQFKAAVTAVLPKQKRQLETNVSQLMGIFESETTVVDTDVKGTAWGAYNTFTYWTDHVRASRQAEARMVKLVEGKDREALHKRLLAFA